MPALSATVLDEVLTSGHMTAADGSRIPVHSQIPREEGEFLQRVIRAVKPKESLEIGLAFGISALFICDALREVGASRHIAIDPHQYEIAPESAHYFPPGGFRGHGVHNLERAGYRDLVTLIQESSDRALPRLAAEGHQFDFAFIDGWHTFDAAFVDWYYVDLMLRPGGAVVFDDLTYPALRKLLRFILRNRPYVALLEQSLPLRPLVAKVLDRPFLRATLRSEIRTPDTALGIRGRWIALQKQADTHKGDGRPGTQRWDHYVEF